MELWERRGVSPEFKLWEPCKRNIFQEEIMDTSFTHVDASKCSKQCSRMICPVHPRAEVPQLFLLAGHICARSISAGHRRDLYFVLRGLIWIFLTMPRKCKVFHSILESESPARAPGGVQGNAPETVRCELTFYIRLKTNIFPFQLKGTEKMITGITICYFF